MDLGKRRRLARLLPAGHGIWLPVDDSLVSGPNSGLRDTQKLFHEDLVKDIDAVLCYRGTARYSASSLTNVPIIENLSASTVNYAHTRKTVVGSIEGAISRGADSVAFHLNISDQSETESLSALGLLSETSEKFGIPMTVIAYPRKAYGDGRDDNYEELRSRSPDLYAELVAHAVRVASELGADAIKTQYTGTVESFAKVVESAQGIPILVAGGPPQGQDTLSIAAESLRAGAAGFCFGRRIFNADDPVGVVRSLRGVLGGVH